MGPLEQEVVDLIQELPSGSEAATLQATGDPNWFMNLTDERRGAMILLTFTGLTNAVRRVARA
jgi:hypothetical protein